MLRLPTPRFLTTLAAVATLSALSLSSSADQRHFTYSYETTTAARGTIELETWATFKHRVDEGQDRNQLQFRHEIEFGVTDRLQLAVYVADWSYDNTDTEHKYRYQGSGAEAIYQLTNPNTSFLGSAIYGEVIVGEDHLKLEGKLLLQKNFGPFIAAYNIGIEAEWEGDEFGQYEEHVGEFVQSLGISYEVTKNFSFGVEALHEFEMEEWRTEHAEAVVYAGPNLSFRYGRAFATITGMFQVTDVEEEPEVQTRLIVGFDF